MGCVLQLKDNSVFVVNTPRDFMDLLDDKLGMDARDWFDNFMRDYELVKDEFHVLQDDLK